jgi:hypothetical protein
VPDTRQNTSHAVMAQRVEPRDSRDDFPSPPWATRALIEHVLKDKEALAGSTCLEPACGAGSMAETLKDYFAEAYASDAFDYGYGAVRDFLAEPYDDGSFDWVITNPPFRLAAAFVLRALRVARCGVAILERTVFLESVGRYQLLFQNNPPTTVAPFVERVPIVKGRLDKSATTATSYAWMVWKKKNPGNPGLLWIPPCRKSLERAQDYDLRTAAPDERLLL